MPYFCAAGPFGTAETDVMPAEVDCLIMSSSPTSNFFELGPSGFSNSSDHEPFLNSPEDETGNEFLDFDATFDVPLDGPYRCRRVATFPPPGGKIPKPSNIKTMHRSKSESAALNRVTLITLDDLKRELHTLVVGATERQKAAAIAAFEEKLASLPDGRTGVTGAAEGAGAGSEFDSGTASAIGSAGQSPASSEESPTENFSSSPTRTFAITRKPARKKVSFADDRGLQLFSVRTMTEASDVPPQISPEILRRIKGDEGEEKPTASWEIFFKQPCSEYLQFRRRLENQSVALENVILKNEQCRLLGTVKVRNLGFEKSVDIRITDNNWISYLDKSAKYSSSVSGDPYDTFSFDFEIPPDEDSRTRLEFCVRYRCNGQEFWDSNEGKNFLLISQKVKHFWASEDSHNRKSTNPGYLHHADGPMGASIKHLDDAYAMDFQNWTGFASWKNLECQGPYW